MKINELIDRVDEICNKLENKKNYDILSKELINKKYKNTDQSYRLIARLIKDDYSLYDISEITIWRLLKVKEKSPILYKEIKKGNIKIKIAYEMLYPNKSKKKTNNELNTNSELDLDKISEFLESTCKALDEFDPNTSKVPSIKTIEEIDEMLYKTRKSLQKIGAAIIEN